MTEIIYEDEIAEGKPKVPVKYKGITGAPASKTTHLERGLFPMGSQVEGKGLKERALRTGLGALDVGDISKRALAQITGQGSLDDPEANVWSKPRQAWRDYMDTLAKKTKGETETVKAPFDPQTRLERRSFERPKSDKYNAAKKLGDTVFEVIGDPLVAAGLLRKLGGSIAKKAGVKAGKVPGDILQVASDLATTKDASALRRYGTGFNKEAKAIRAASGSEYDVGQQLVQSLDNFDELIPTKRMVDDALKNMPDIETSGIIKKLENSLIDDAITESAKQANKKITKTIDGIREIAPEGALPAARFRKLRIQFDQDIPYGQSYKKFVDDAYYTARRAMADDLITSAKKSGNSEYVLAMKDYSKKLQARDKVAKYLGSSPWTMENRAESFGQTLFGKGKTQRQKAVKNLDEAYGKNFYKKLRQARDAAEMGPHGRPPLKPHPTGIGALGAIAGGFSGGGPGVAAGIALSSPKMAAFAMEAADFAFQVMPARAIKQFSTPQAMAAAIKTLGIKDRNELKKALEESQKSRGRMKALNERTVTNILKKAEAK